MVVLAQEEARSLKHNYIGTEHLLLGLLRAEAGLAAGVLASLEITVAQVRANVMRIVGAGEEVTSGQIPFTPRAKKVLELALREALNLGHNHIGTEHILLGLTRENEGVAARILTDLGADSEKLRNQVIRMLGDPAAQAQAEAEAEWKWESMAIGSRPRPQVLDRAWFGGLGVVLDELTGEIRRELGREPDSGDLLLVLAGAPDTLAGRTLRELGARLDGLAGLVQRHRAQALAEDELAQHLQQLNHAKQQAIENVAQLRETVAQLRAQERELREQAEARAAVGPEVLDELRRQLGIPDQTHDPPPPAS